MKGALIVLLLCSSVLMGQEVFSPRIRGLRVTGTADARFPIAEKSSRPITIEFDMNEPNADDFIFRFYHCDRNWQVTRTMFVNDEMQNRTRMPIPYESAPAGVREYRFHYSLSIPGFIGFKEFPHSGNYLFELWDYNQKNLLARGRFFVVERLVQPRISIEKRLLPEGTNPLNQVHEISTSFSLPHPDSISQESFYPLNLSTVDVFKNRELFNSRRVDTNDQDPQTFVDGFGTAKLSFIIRTIMPGKEYRQIDLRKVEYYPAGKPARSREGADVSRFLAGATPANFGTSTFSIGNAFADYLPFQFELLLEQRILDPIYVVGDFNGWRSSPASAMVYNEEQQRYVWQTSLRRGLYDYQYVVAPNDWTRLEGNDWQTGNVYTALVYYKDVRFGGFDRIIGFAQRRSAGSPAR
ncbi:MAG: type IX secretion system plug protein domain-containing protein [bacterium]